MKQCQADDDLFLVWRKSIYTFDEDVREKSFFTFSFPVTLNCDLDQTSGFLT